MKIRNKANGTKLSIRIWYRQMEAVTKPFSKNESNYQILQNKGAFVDLYSFMENDPEVNTDTLDTHVLEVNEIDGKLYTLPDFYHINTLQGESKYVGTKENWTFDEFEEH